VTFDGQLSVQTVDATVTVAEELAELSFGCSSFVVLETLAALVIVVPSDVPAFTLKANENIAVALAGNVAIVQVIVPVALPAVGATHVNAGPEF
jgi:hypothetical protein